MRVSADNLFRLLKEGQITSSGFLRVLASFEADVPQEGAHIELKSAEILRKHGKERVAFFKHIAAFASHPEGTVSFLFVGIANKRAPENHTFSAEERRFIVHAFDEHPENYVNPPAMCDWVIRPYAGGELLCVCVFGDGRRHVCALNNTAYRRDGAKTVPVP